jgi:hypothetical protein
MNRRGVFYFTLRRLNSPNVALGRSNLLALVTSDPSHVIWPGHSRLQGRGFSI